MREQIQYQPDTDRCQNIIAYTVDSFVNPTVDHWMKDPHYFFAICLSVLLAVMSNLHKHLIKFASIISTRKYVSQ